MPQGLQIVASITCPELLYNIKSAAYVCAKVRGDDSQLGTCDNVFLKYIVGDSSDDRGIEDEYQLENFDVELSDFMLPLGESFNQLWEYELGKEYENSETFVFPNFKTLDEAVAGVSKFLGLEVHNNTGRVRPDAIQHTLDIGGRWYGVEPVIAKAKFIIEIDVKMELAIRCANREVRDQILQSVEGQ